MKTKMNHNHRNQLDSKLKSDLSKIVRETMGFVCVILTIIVCLAVVSLVNAISLNSVSLLVASGCFWVCVYGLIKHAWHISNIEEDLEFLGLNKRFVRR